MRKVNEHNFCRFLLRETRKEYQYFKKISGLGDVYYIDGKIIEIPGACCRYSGRADAIVKSREDKERRRNEKSLSD